MKSYQKILVGITYTDSCRRALQQARQIAKDSGAAICAFHAVPPVTLNEYLNFYLIPHDSIMSTALDGLKTFVEETLGPNHGVRCDVAEGKPHQAVVAFARECQADLLILGTDEYAKKPYSSGKFAIKCLRHADIPVLLVRNHVDRPFAKLTTCVDFSKSTTPVLEHTAKLNFNKEQTVEILHASRPPWLRPPYFRYQTEVFEDSRVKEQYHEIINGEMNTVKESAIDLFLTDPTTVIPEHEDPRFALLDHLRESKSELAVLGHWGKGAHSLKTKLLGSTAETVIRYADCSVLVVPVDS